MNLLIAYAPDFTPEMYAALEALGYRLRFLPGDERENYDDLDFSEVEAILCFRFFCYNDIARFPALRLIQLTSHGTDHLPHNTLRARGIRCFDARGTYGGPIAEFALCGVLQLYKCAPLFRAQQTAHLWLQNRALRELAGQTVCIVGTGSLGTECARRFSAMGCRVLGVCRHPRAAAGFDEQLPLSALDDILPESDIVILTLPLTEETRGMIDARRFARMKSGAVLVNVARGPIVREAALIDALRSGHLSGAVIDVAEIEPLPTDSPLWDMDNVILTPHNSFAGSGNARRLFDLTYRNLKAAMQEERNEADAAEIVSATTVTGIL